MPRSAPLVAVAVVALLTACGPLESPVAPDSPVLATSAQASAQSHDASSIVQAHLTCTGAGGLWNANWVRYAVVFITFEGGAKLGRGLNCAGFYADGRSRDQSYDLEHATGAWRVFVGFRDEWDYSPACTFTGTELPAGALVCGYGDEAWSSSVPCEETEGNSPALCRTAVRVSLR